jgi:cobalt-zinc-cadmium efflux system outer membrane protein
VTTTFVLALSAQERLALADELIAIAEASVATVASQVSAGAVSPLEEGRARVALDRSRLERIQLTHELSAAKAELAATWGSTEVTFDSLRGRLEGVATPPPVASLVAAIDKTPDLARWASELEHRRASLELEEARSIPDVTIGLGVRRFNEDDSTGAVLAVSVPLPLFDRNQGSIAEARHRLTKTQAEQASAIATVRSALTRAYESLQAAHAEVTTLRDSIIPRAKSVYQGAKENHARGLFRYLEVLDAQRTLFELRSQYLEALAAYHIARAEVERLSGIDIASMPGRNS